MPRRRTIALWSAASVALAATAAALLVVSATQSAYGQERVRRYLERTLASRVKGSLYVGRISGSFLAGVTIDSVAIREPDGTLFVSTGPVKVQYSPRDLLDRRIVLSRLEVEHPVVYITKSHDESWNFRRLFPRGPKDSRREGRQFGDFVVLDSMVVRDARFTLTMPWHPADSLRGARRDSAVRTNLARTDVSIRRVAGGFARSWEWRNGRLDLASARLADPDRRGRIFRIARLDVDEHDPPFPFRNVRGDVRILGDSAWLGITHFDLPGSTGSGAGKVVWGSDLPTRYDLRIRADSLSLGDVAWVYPTMPRAGGGRALLAIRNDPSNLRILEYRLSGMDMRTTGSRVTGAVTFATGGPVLAVRDAELDFSPLDFRLVEQFNGAPLPLPFRGQITGTLRGRGGPLNRFRVDESRLVFRDANVPGATTTGSARGTIDVLRPAYARFLGFDVDIDQLDLRTIRYLNPEFAELDGFVSGRATLDSSWLDVRFRDASLAHIDGDGESSRVEGRGRLTYGERFMTYDLDLVARPLDFTTLARSYPGLPLRGSYAGPLRLTGTTESLTLATALTGPAGRLTADARLDLDAPRYAARGSFGLEAVDLRVLLAKERLRATSLTGTIITDLAGDSLANLAGSIAIDLDRSEADGVRLYASTARLRMVPGLLAVDSLRLETSAATLAARGGIGLDREHADSLRLVLSMDSLGGMRRYLPASLAADTLTGSATVNATVAGTIDRSGSLALRMEGRGHSLRAGDLRARSLRLAADLDSLRGRPRGRLALSLDTAVVSGIAMSKLQANVDSRDGREAAVRVLAENERGTSALLGGSVARVDTVTTSARVEMLVVSDNARSWRLVQPAAFLLRGGDLSGDSLVLAGDRGGRIAVGGRLPRTGEVDIALRADQVPLSGAGLFLRSGGEFGGRASLSLRMTGTRQAPLMNLDARLDSARVGDVRLDAVTATGTYADHRAIAALRVRRGGVPALSADLSLPLDLALRRVARRRLDDDSLAASIRTDSVGLAVVEAFTSRIRRARGRLEANIAVRGTWSAPEITGALRVADGSATLPHAGTELRRINADVVFLRDSVRVRRLVAQSGDHRRDTLALTGVLSLADRGSPTFDLRMFAHEFRLLDRPSVASLDMTAALALAGSTRNSRLTGEIVIPRGDIHIPEFVQKKVVSLDDPELYRIVDTTLYRDRNLLPGSLPPVVDSIVRNLVADNVRLVMGENVWLRSAEANIKLDGALSVTTGRSDRGGDSARVQLALTGGLGTERGTYRLNLGPLVERTFEVERGSLRFFGDPDLNPTLDIIAIHTVRQLQGDLRDVRIRVHIGGTLARPELRLSSADDIARSQSDLISYLVTGQPSFEVGGPRGELVNTAASVLLPSLDYFASGIRRLTNDVIDVAQLQTVSLAEGDQIRGNVLTGTRLALGSQVNDRTFIGINAGLCQIGQQLGLSAQSGSGDDRSQLAAFRDAIGVKIEHRFNHGISVAAGVEPGSQALTCSPSGNVRGFAPIPRQYSLDLLRRWTF